MELFWKNATKSNRDGVQDYTTRCCGPHDPDAFFDFVTVLCCVSVQQNGNAEGLLHCTEVRLTPRASRVSGVAKLFRRISGCHGSDVSCVSRALTSFHSCCTSLVATCP